MSEEQDKPLPPSYRHFVNWLQDSCYQDVPDAVLVPFNITVKLGITNEQMARCERVFLGDRPWIILERQKFQG